MANIGKTAKLSVATLAIMNVTAVVSLRGLPAEAEYGISSAFYYLFAALVFLIPTALVAAELAAMFSNKQGGVFRWVGEAFGKRMGFLAIWLQWVESTIWYPTVLTFGAVSLAFIGMDSTHDMTLASNRMYTLVVVLVIYWLATFISLKGMSWVGRVSKIGGLVGTIIPAALLVVLAIIYLLTGGNPLKTNVGAVPGSVGETDLLITWLFKITTGSTSDYKTASVVGILIFVVVAVLSLIVYNVMPSNRNEEDFK